MEANAGVELNMLLTDTTFSMESRNSTKPTCFVYTDEGGKLKINPDAIDVLDKIKEPIFVVSVCGLDHDGKDFILNQLLGRSSEFHVASTHQAGTEGIWMWDTSLKKTALDGTSYNILLLFNVGIQVFDQTETCTSQIFSLAILLSSLFMHNQDGVIERTKPDQVGGIVMTGPILAGITTSFLNALNSGEISSLQGTIIKVIKKLGVDISSEKNSSILNYLVEDKMELLYKQLESSEKIKTEYQKHYEHAIDDLKNLSNSYNSRITDLDTKCSILEDRCSSLLEMLDTEKQESYEWKRKYEEIFTKVRGVNKQDEGKMAFFKSEHHEAEARVAAAKEKAQLAQEEASEWKAKYDAAANEITVIKNEVAVMSERSTAEAKLREEALQAKFSNILLEKDKGIKDVVTKLKNAEERLTTLSLGLKDIETKMLNFVMESSDFKHQIKEFADRVEVVETSAQSVERKAEMLVQDGTQLEQKYITELKRFEETSEKCKVSREEIMVANEFIEAARSQLLTAQNELRSTQQLAAERLSQIEIEHRHVEILQRQNTELAAEVERLRMSEANVTSKVSLLGTVVKERDQEIESLKLKYEQRISQAFGESLDADQAEAVRMPETPSLEPGPRETKTDIFLLDSEYSSEPAPGSALETPVHMKRSRLEVFGTSSDSFQDADIDEKKAATELKKPKLETPLHKCTLTHVEDSVLKQNGEGNQISIGSSVDYSKFTVKKLRQELCENGFTAELLALKYPKKKDIVALYEKVIINNSTSD